MAAEHEMEVEIDETEDGKSSQKVYHTFAMVTGEVKRARHAKPQEYFFSELPQKGHKLRAMYAEDIPEDWGRVFCHEFSWNKKLPRPTNGNVIEIKIRAAKRANKQGEHTPEIAQVFSIHKNPKELCESHGAKVPKNWTEHLKKHPMHQGMMPQKQMGGKKQQMGGQMMNPMMGGGQMMNPMMGGGQMMNPMMAGAMMGGGGDFMGGGGDFNYGPMGMQGTQHMNMMQMQQQMAAAAGYGYSPKRLQGGRGGRGGMGKGRGGKAGGAKTGGAKKPKDNLAKAETA